MNPNDIDWSDGATLLVEIQLRVLDDGALPGMISAARRVAKEMIDQGERGPREEQSPAGAYRVIVYRPSN
jgi:hypothetical protein